MQHLKLISGLLFYLLVMTTGLSAVPVVTSITPNAGPSTGGTIVTLTGSGFTGVTSIRFGDVVAPVFAFVSDTTITVTSPAARVGNVNIFVTVGANTSAASQDNIFTYQGNWILYDAIGGSNIVASADLGTNVPGPTYPVPTAQNSVVSPTGGFVYASEGAAAAVAFIIPRTGLVSNIPIGGTTSGIALMPDGSSLYVVTPSPSRVTRVNAITGAIMSTITIPGVAQLPNQIVINPDGSKVYVACGNGSKVVVISTATDSITNTIATTSLIDINITPDGSLIYISDGFSNIRAISTATETIVAGPFAVSAQPISGSILPDSSAGLLVSTPANILTRFTIPGNVITATPATPGSPTSIITAPDGLHAYVHIDGTNIAIFDVTTNTFTGSIPIAGSGGGPHALSITPDQAPVAHFTITQATIGSPTIFDASLSVSPTGTIVNYAWDFGDGTTASTASPIIEHTYLTPGTFIVRLTVTNSAGTSTTQLYNGRNLYRNGGPVATTTQTITAVPSGPFNLIARTLREIFLTQAVPYNILTWTSNPTDPSISGFFVLKNGVLVASLVGRGPYEFIDRGICPQIPITYTLISFNINGGAEGVPVNVTLP